MKIPEQLSRILFVVGLLVCAAVVLRLWIIPRSYFSTEAHHEATMAREAAHVPRFAGTQSCYECHDDVFAARRTGYHRAIGCEACHGPCQEHASSDEPEMHRPASPRDRKSCPVCHSYDSARPTGFPQIDPKEHNPRKACIKCHDPHDPVPPEKPQECSACHAQIARTKDLSKHADLKCQECHTVPEQHFVTPRASLPSKPDTREFCAPCHDKNGPESDTPKVDMIEHGGNYLCWQCHYAHLPEGI